jgi:hypothetical protein
MRELNSARIGKSKKIFSPEVKRQHVDDWHKSGLSMSDYCRCHDLAVSTFSVWHQNQEGPSRLKLKPLKIPAVSSPSPSATALEIHLPGGIQIRLADAQDVATFKTILEVIKSCN